VIGRAARRRLGETESFRFSVFLERLCRGEVLPDRVPSYRLHKQSGQAIVTLSGRDHLLVPYGTAASRAE
jgi:hypothetical protein